MVEQHETNNVIMYNRHHVLSSASAFSFVPPSALLHNRITTQRNHSQQQTRNHKIKVTSKFKIDIVTLGKKTSKDAMYEESINEYVRRLKGTMDIKERSIKKDMAIRTIHETIAKQHSIIILDAEKGILPENSIRFSELLFKYLQRGRCHTSFFIGDSDGFPRDITDIHDGPLVTRLSLSPLTLTHKMVTY